MPSDRGGRRDRVLYIALEDIDFIWDDRHLSEVKEKWRDGLTIMELAKEFSRSPMEMFLLVLDLWYSGNLKMPRSHIMDLIRTANIHTFVRGSKNIRRVSPSFLNNDEEEDEARDLRETKSPLNAENPKNKNSIIVRE
jgi:hypothetical protein